MPGDVPFTPASTQHVAFIFNLIISNVSCAVSEVESHVLADPVQGLCVTVPPSDRRIHPFQPREVPRQFRGNVDRGKLAFFVKLLHLRERFLLSPVSFKLDG